MSKLGWGKPRIIVKDLDDPSAVWKEFPTPVQNSSQLTTTKGEKQEAKLEGGENEDVRYNKNSYALVTNIRAAKNRARPIPDVDGVVEHKYAVVLQPEDKDVPGVAIECSTVSVEDTFSTEEGGIWAYTFDALKPDTGRKQVMWGKIIITEDGSISKVECDPTGIEGEASEKFEVAAAKA